MIIIFGPAGAGKSVQGKLLADKNNWKWLSAGQLLRDANDPEIIEFVSKGNLAPTDKVNELIAKALKEIANIDQIILDGFPREVEEAVWLLQEGPFHGHLIDAVILLEVTKDEVIKRLTLRNRADDTPQAIEERLDIYDHKMRSVLDYFVAKNIKIIHIDGIGTIDQVNHRIMEELAKCNLVKH